MDLDLYANQLYFDDFKQEYSERHDEVISMISNSKDEFELAICNHGLDSILSKKRDPNYHSDTIIIDGNSLTIASFSDSVLDEIINTIPPTIKKLTIDKYIYDKCKRLLKRFPNLEELNFLRDDESTLIGLEQLIENTAIKRMHISKLQDEDYNQKGLIGSTIRDHSFAVYNGHRYDIANGFFQFDISNSVFFNKDNIDEIREYVYPSMIDKDSHFSILQYGNTIFRSSKNKVEFLLTDPIKESLHRLEVILEVTGIEPESIKLMTSNKSYSDLNELYKFNKYKNVMVDYENNDKCTIDEFIQMRGTLDYYVGLIKQNNLSPAERLCYAYDLIKSNIYTEVDEDQDLSLSRNIHSIVDTGKIVCVGYAVFLAELLKELGIEAHSIGTEVPMKDGTIAGHERNLVMIDDDKYNIHGTYAFDCTWDSNKIRYHVIRDGEDRIVSKVKEDDQLVRIYDNMSSYSNFFIPYQCYSLFFPGEKLYRDIKDFHGYEFDPQHAALESIPGFLGKKETTDVFDTAPILSEETIISLIHNTRMYEGYSKELNDQLIDEVSDIRRNDIPKELRTDTLKTR